MEERSSRKRAVPPLDTASLDRLAIHYVGRYATTRARLRQYLKRKIAERGWAGESPADLTEIAERMSEAGYIDDAAFAATRTDALLGRGYGGRRIAQNLSHAGIDAKDRPTTDAQDAFEAAERFARRRRIGPYAPALPDPDQKRRQFAAFVRAGHALDLIKRFIDAAPDEHPDPPEQD